MKYKGYTKEEEEICWTIWGCVPVDYIWAKSTDIFKDKLKEIRNINKE